MTSSRRLSSTTSDPYLGALEKSGAPTSLKGATFVSTNPSEPPIQQQAP